MGYVAASRADVEVNSSKEGKQCREVLQETLLLHVSFEEMQRLRCRRRKQLIGRVRRMFAASEFVRKLSNLQKRQETPLASMQMFFANWRTFFSKFVM